MHNLLAQDVSFGGSTIKGPLQLAGGQPATLSGIVNTVLMFLVPFSAVILFFVLIWGGYNFIMSQGNPEKIKAGKQKITYGFIGFIVLIFAYLVAKLLASIFHLN